MELVRRSETLALATKRLVLRELSDDDAIAVSNGAGDRRVAQYLIQVPSPYPPSLARRWIDCRRAWWREGRGMTLAITRTGDPALLGTVSLKVSRMNRRAELGYWLGADAWGQGYATEACRELVRFGFDELALNRVFAQVLAGNDASCRVLDKLGMLREGVKRGHVRKGGALVDVIMYGLLRDER